MNQNTSAENWSNPVFVQLRFLRQPCLPPDCHMLDIHTYHFVVLHQRPDGAQVEDQVGSKALPCRFAFESRPMIQEGQVEFVRFPLAFFYPGQIFDNLANLGRISDTNGMSGFPFLVLRI